MFLCNSPKPRHGARTSDLSSQNGRIGIGPLRLSLFVRSHAETENFSPMFWRPAFGDPVSSSLTSPPFLVISNCQGNFVLRIHRLSGGVPERGEKHAKGREEWREMPNLDWSESIIMRSVVGE